MTNQNSISGLGYYDWQITVIFYAALHEVRAALNMREVNLFDYTRRERIDHGTIIRAVRDQFGQESSEYYSDLLQLSYSARYSAEVELTQEDYTDAFELFNKIGNICTMVMDEWITGSHSEVEETVTDTPSVSTASS